MTSQHNGVFSMVSQQNLVEAHQGASVPLGRRRSGEIPAQVHWYNSATLLHELFSQQICSRHELFSQQICKERRDDFIPVDQEECEPWKGEGEGVDLWLLAWFPWWISLSCVSLSTELVSHASKRSHTEAGPFPGNFQRSTELVGAEVILYLNFLGKTLHVTLFYLC